MGEGVTGWGYKMADWARLGARSAAALHALLNPFPRPEGLTKNHSDIHQLISLHRAKWTCCGFWGLPQGKGSVVRK